VRSGDIAVDAVDTIDLRGAELSGLGGGVGTFAQFGQRLADRAGSHPADVVNYGSESG
jgi:hypothetical protein